MPTCETCFYLKYKTVTHSNGAVVREQVPVCAFNWPDSAKNSRGQAPMATWPQVSLNDWCGWYSSNGVRVDQGPSGSVTVGTTSTLPPGETAYVDNSGTSTAAVLGFHIPQGTKGADGFGYDSQCTNYTVSGVTTNATPAVLSSVVMAQNTDLVLDGKISFWQTSDRTLGGYIWPTLSYGRGTGAPAARGTVDINESHNLAGCSATFVVNTVSNSIDITVTGKAATSITWSGLFVARRS